MPHEYFDIVVACFSFHHFKDQNKALEEMKRVLKPDGRLIIFESNPTTRRGKTLELIENLLHTDAKFYEPFQLKKLAEKHNLDIISIESVSLGYFLIATSGKTE